MDPFAYIVGLIIWGTLVSVVAIVRGRQYRAAIGRRPLNAEELAEFRSWKLLEHNPPTQSGLWLRKRVRALMEERDGLEAEVRLLRCESHDLRVVTRRLSDDEVDQLNKIRHGIL